MTSATTLAALVAQCRKLTRRQQTTDAELLRRLAEQRDAAAFEELLERHASLVWGVCRRIVRSEADCEDAFQAVFLTLFRRAKAIDPSRPLGAWLHGVAVRAALKAAADAARKPTLAVVPEQATSGDIADELANRELFRVVDEEIARLPALLREAFVLCCLDGQTRDEAAMALGCSVAAIKSRLERSRDLLRRRLQRRGFGLPVAFLVLGLTGGTVRASLRAKALQSALGCASPAVAALLPTAGVSLTNKLALAAMSLVMAGVLGFGAFHTLQSESPQEIAAPAKDAAPKSPVSENLQPRSDRFGDPLPPGAIRRFGTLRFRHDYPIRYLAFTPDGKQLISGKTSDPLAVFDVATGRRLRTIGKNGRGNRYGFAISPDGKSVICGGVGRLWNLQTGKLIRQFGDDTGKWDWASVAFSPDGKIIAAAGNRGAEIKMVEADTGKLLVEQTLKPERAWPPQYELSDLEFSPDGTFLAAILSEHKVLKRKNNPPALEITVVPFQVWVLDAAKGTLVRSFGSAEEPLSSFAFQPNSGRLAAIGKDNAIRFWDAKTGQEVQRIAASRKGETLRILRFLDGGRHCALSVCENKTETDFLSIVDVKDGRELRRLKLRENRWVAAPIALSADGRTVATANEFREACVRVWDVPSGVERLADAGHRTGATLSLSTDDRTLISRGYQGRIIHWDLRTGNGQIKPADANQEEGQPYETAEEWSLRGPRWRLVLHRKTSEMEVRSRDGSRLLRKVKWTSARWWNAVLSPDGAHVTVSIHDDDNVVLLWDPERESAPRKLVELPADLYRHNLLFSHDGKRLIVGAGFYNKSQPNALWVWDVATAKIIRKLPIQYIPDHLILSGDDRLLIVGSGWADATVHVWDMETGKEKNTLTDPSLPPMQPGKEEWDLNVAGLHLSADERFLAVVTHRGDSTGISVWETAAWKPVRAFPWTRFQNNPHSMAFSHDGRSLFVSNSDSTILEWGVSGLWANGRRQPAEEILNLDRLHVLWRTLRQTPDKAYPAVWELLDRPAESLRFLIGKLELVKPIEAKTVRRWLAQLESESYAEREEATRQLLMLGEQTLPVLRQALQEKPSLETKRRVEGLIDSLTRVPDVEQLRLLRALAVLEWSERPEAAAHLRRLAAGARFASLTQAALAAQQRLRKKALGGS